MKFDLNTEIALGSFLMGIGSTLVAGYRWQREHDRKMFAAEREFNHLKNDNEQLKGFVITLENKVDELHAAVVETRGAISVLLGRSLPCETNPTPQLPKV
jgi:hypothetical protein